MVLLTKHSEPNFDHFVSSRAFSIDDVSATVAQFAFGDHDHGGCICWVDLRQNNKCNTCRFRPDYCSLQISAVLLHRPQMCYRSFISDSMFSNACWESKLYIKMVKGKHKSFLMSYFFLPPHANTNGVRVASVGRPPPAMWVAVSCSRAHQQVTLTVIFQLEVDCSTSTHPTVFWKP